MARVADSDRMHSRLKLCVVAALAALALAATIGVVAAVLSGYDRVAHLVIVAAGKPHQEAAFKAAYFTPITYGALVATVAVLAIAAGWSAYWLSTRFDRVVASIGTHLPAIRASAASVATRFTRLDPVTKLSLGILVALQMVLCVRRAATLPVTYDEAWTFMNFTMRPLFASMTYYPAPNNHVLYSVLANAAHLLPVEPMFGMRLVSVAFALLTTLALCALALRHWDQSAVVLALSLLVFSYPIAVYAVLARGYMMLVFFTAICFGSVLAGLVAARPSVPLLIGYVVCAVCGFYTIPLFLYPFASVNAFKFAYLLARRRPLSPWLIADITIAVITLLLYTPIILVNGISAVTANVYVARAPLPVALGQLPGRLVATANWLLGIDRGGIAVILAIVLAVLVLRRRRDGPPRLMEWAMAVVALLPPAILVAHRTNPQQRTWVYLMVPLYFLTLGLIESAIVAARHRGLRARWALPFAVVAVAVLTSRPFAAHFGRDFVEDFDAERLFDGIPAAAIQSIAHDDVSVPYDEPLYFADVLAYRAQLQRRDPVRTERLSADHPTDADALVVSLDGAERVPNLHDYYLWRQRQRLAVYLRKP